LNDRQGERAFITSAAIAAPKSKSALIGRDPIRVLPGQYYDAETGLYYNWNRYYDPKTGRYITSDPIGLLASTNPYAYARSNPAFWSDALGLNDVHIITSPLSPANGLFPPYLTPMPLDGTVPSPLYPDRVITVDDLGIPIAEHRGSTMPDSRQPACQNKNCPRILPGIHPFRVEMFPHEPRVSIMFKRQYPALYLGTVPTIEPDPNNGDQMEMNGAWLHHGLGLIRNGSEGCPTLDPRYWDDFMRNHSLGETGKVYVW
jgi:RHS repeat-associated protein